MRDPANKVAGRAPVPGWDATYDWKGFIAFDQLWSTPLCMLAMAAPSLYVTWRIKAHRACRLRCDWAPN